VAAWRYWNQELQQAGARRVSAGWQ